MYHHVGPLPENADDIRRGLTASAENFDSQLKYLKDNQYNIVTLKKLYESVAKGEDVSKSVVLTFDDGYLDNYEYAWNAMQKYGVNGTFFIISGKIGQNEYMNKEQIKALSAGANEIASHSVAHPSMEKLSTDKARSELSDSKKALEQLTGQSIISFCYPAGKYNDETKRLASEAGYKIAVTTQKGEPFSTNEPFEIPRYRINPTTSLKSLFK
jgi:peptidoglycan/xylan/chitin deacetylase (PgdA/CDA1 family)